MLCVMAILAVDVRFGSQADMKRFRLDVRFTPESGHSSPPSRCQLWAKSGHRGL